ncbi:ABC transporter ATP-binding protein [uncultured Tenacibaculum sp.]|uniref:ABC transporter ATP-binding protein n=1 Tax=uncultured Tenacibaculum sp. TaxID=174713 RepID=UPI00261FA2ED|nr:ABC transporter ATP-binding protein [uncultured Tenacibaculum sp.]
MLRINDLNKTYRNGEHNLHVLKDISLSIKEGEFVSIMGPSGSGKSTLLSILGILDYSDDGLYELNGISIKDLSQSKAAKIRNNFIGFIFQSFNLIPYKSALENVALPLFYQKKSKKERTEVAIENLKKVGLGNRIHHLPNELSGGQNQRVAIARALATSPKIILADEPTGALDSKTSIAIMELLKEINNKGITVIVITHEDEIANMTDRIIYLKDGKIKSDKLV